MTVYPIRQLEIQIEEQKSIVAGHAPGVPRLAELELERLEVLLTNARRAEATRQAVLKQRDDEARKREQDERAALEAKLTADYIASTPGTTAQEAASALPDLLHRHRLAQLDRREADLATARRRVRL